MLEAQRLAQEQSGGMVGTRELLQALRPTRAAPAACCAPSTSTPTRSSAPWPR